MGYYTIHELEIIEGNDNQTDYEAEICEFVDYKYLFDVSVKWYDCEKDMIEYSKKHKNTLFLIKGDGEESGDLWKAYFKNGKMQVCRAKVIFDEFNENLLQ